jgi:hypothetical protein
MSWRVPLFLTWWGTRIHHWGRCIWRRSRAGWSPGNLERNPLFLCGWGCCRTWKATVKPSRTIRENSAWPEMEMAKTINRRMWHTDI